MPIAETGMTVFWADGTVTSFTLLGDLQTARFPNTDESTTDPATGQKHPGFFDWFGGPVWSQAPADGKPGIRQSLIVDSETISSNVGRLLELMRDGIDFNGKPVAPPLNEWGVPPGVITPLMAHAAAATRFERGWAASDIRRKYMPGSVASDPQPKPEPDKPTVPGTNQEAEELRKKLAEQIALRETAEKDLALATGKLKTVGTTMKTFALSLGAEAPEKGGGKYAKALRKRSVLLLQLVEKLALVLLLALLPLTGCAGIRALWPGGVTAGDAEWKGAKTGQPVPVALVLSALDPRAEQVNAVLTLLDKREALGVLLPVKPVGEDVVRWIYCGGSQAQKCAGYPLNTTVHFAGKPIPLEAEFKAALTRAIGGAAPDHIWRPARIVADGFND